MALDSMQQQLFDRRIEAMKEDGFFLPSNRALSGDTRYLIVSYGGTGAKALFGVKKKFETILSETDLMTRVRFLAIDTDEATQKNTVKETMPDGTVKTVEVGRLEPSEFFQLPGNAARNLFNGNEIPQNVQTWINPELVRMIHADSELLSGDGASGIRQLGRLTLYPSNTVSQLTSRIKTLVGELTHDNTAPLRVFILSGIAGGTGSGTVVDLSYLIRDSISQMATFSKTNRADYCGFIMLPPTGSSSDPSHIHHGNRNGYAALKEINHFMTIQKRGEKYSFTYGDGRVVESYENIFKTCYLMDGVSDGVAHSKPMQRVVEVLSESLLDMITANQVQDDAGQNIQAVDSFMNDAATFTTQMISNRSVQHAMRDADYHYCALGHSEFAMPSNEIKAYVAKQMFDMIYQLFRKCANVEEEDVREFVKNVINRGVGTESATMKAMNMEITSIFQNLGGKKGGPWYAINLLHDVKNETGHIRGKAKLFRYKQVTDESLSYIERAANKLNNETFNVFVVAMDALKNMMEAQYGVVVKGGQTGNVYSFMPVDLGNIESADYVIQYLDKLINPGNLKKMTNELLSELLNNRDAWVAIVNTDVDAGQRAAAAMRKFWNTHLDAMINSTMEDFLIKYFAQNTEAFYDPNNHAGTVEYLRQAATAIYDYMLGVGGKAQPMVYLTPMGLTADNFNGHTYLMVPQSAPHLCEELRKIAAQKSTLSNAVKVCTSFATDIISCYRQYTSIPAFKLSWALDAEKAYETDMQTVAGYGTHMSETAGGRRWLNFPNLLPKSTWSILSEPYSNNREAALADKADVLFNKAMELSMTTGKIQGVNTTNVVYEVRVLPAQFRPDEMMFKELDILQDGSPEKREKLAALDNAAQDCANKLFATVGNWQSAKELCIDLEKAGVAFSTRELNFPNGVLTYTPGDPKPENWDEYMAACMLRKLPETMQDLESTIMVMDKLAAMVKKQTESRVLIGLFAQYLVTKMFSYDEEQMVWSYKDEKGILQELTYLESELEKSGQFYFMFNDFRNNADAIVAALAEQFAEVSINDATPRAERAARNKVFMDGGKALQAAIVSWINTNPMKAYEVVAAKKGYNLRAIAAFYKALMQEADMMGQVGYIAVEYGEKKDEVVEENPGDFLW